MDTTLVIGNKNYSSWSLRAWLPLRQAGLSFREEVIPLRRKDTAERILTWSPSGKVPALLHEGNTIWDSLAIGEYLADLCPQVGLLPAERPARARARSIIAEMHAGFVALRKECPMDMRAHRPAELSADTQRDVERISAIWEDCLEAVGGTGFLFGAPGLADAFYAPVASRFATYGILPGPLGQAYMQQVQEWPLYQEWLNAARQEAWDFNLTA
ncbi:glutathione S-transferase family protein [Fodinicurvata fenggangensis]|uniref:glutathione S-transferase family protein n=1 Tax=Fodinicurvata fenggangensis TaxID=1121830 RepID=UPI00047A9CE6|nr:glutathione S-transferase family protein [Fodinicurvata fenggangensis]